MTGVLVMAGVHVVSAVLNVVLVGAGVVGHVVANGYPTGVYSRAALLSCAPVLTSSATTVHTVA